VREFSVPPIVTIGDDANLTDPVWENVQIAPDQVLFVRPDLAGGDDAPLIEVTCRQFRDEVVALAQGLVAAGVQPGMRVALMSKTRYEWTLFDYAIWAAGAVTVPIYETSSAEQAAWILSDSGAYAVVIENDEHAKTIEGVRGGLGELAHVWQIDKGAVAQLTAEGTGVDPAEIDVRRKGVKANDMATIIYTSGTTGRPKGCILTHRNMHSDISNAIPVLPNLFREGATTVLFLPLAHAFARLIQIGVVQTRSTTLHVGDVKKLVPELQRFRPTFVLSVPRVFEKVYNTAKQKAAADGKGAIFAKAEQTAIAYSEALDTPGGPGLGLKLKHKLFDKLVYGKLRAALGGRCNDAISGGAPLGVRLTHFFRGIGVAIVEGYGLTETAPAAAANVVGHTRIGTVGRPLPGVSIRIAEDDEILIKGDIVFPGYWKNPEATAEAIDTDGWFRTGDLGKLDDEGYLSITGRKKEIIVTAGGKNVAPAVLEDRVRSHPLISQCLVVGDRQPFIAALITIDEEAWPKWCADHDLPATTDVADVRDDERLRAEVQKAIDEANAAVSKAEAIKVFRILPADFTEITGELTPSMKVKRGVVHKNYADEIAHIYQG